jgi:hypothetical protein
MPENASAGTSTISIDRLTLRLSGLSESDGRRLAELIGEGLAAQTSAIQTADVSKVRTSLTARPGSAIRGLAEEAVADILRQLQRSA